MSDEQYIFYLYFFSNLNVADILQGVQEVGYFPVAIVHQAFQHNQSESWKALGSRSPHECLEEVGGSYRNSSWRENANSYINTMQPY